MFRPMLSDTPLTRYGMAIAGDVVGGMVSSKALSVNQTVGRVAFLVLVLLILAGRSGRTLTRRHSFIIGKCDLEGVRVWLAGGATDMRRRMNGLAPLHDRIATHVLAAERLHGDDTPGAGARHRGRDRPPARLWVYVRGDRPFAGGAPPAALLPLLPRPPRRAPAGSRTRCAAPSPAR